MKAYAHHNATGADNEKNAVIFTLAALSAIVISVVGEAVPLEQKLIRIHAIEILSEFPEIENETNELQAALADMADDPVLVLKAKAV